MTAGAAPARTPNDYSLIGKQAAEAVQNGLADAKWYTPSPPR